MIVLLIWNIFVEKSESSLLFVLALFLPKLQVRYTFAFSNAIYYELGYFSQMYA